MKRIFAAALLLTLSASTLSAATIFFRGGLGIERARDTTLRDVNCDETDPPALFGCGVGPDGRSLAARGDFDNATSLELGAGIEAGRHTLLELLVAHRTGMEFEGLANFTGITGEQPVRASASSTSAMLAWTYMMGTGALNAHPFLTAGVGIARNRIGDTTLHVPGLAPNAQTIIRGGLNNEFAWMAGVGVAFPLGDTTDLDVAFRYTYLGDVRTDNHRALVVRPEGRTVMDIAASRADLDTLGVSVSVRFRP